MTVTFVSLSSWRRASSHNVIAMYTTDFERAVDEAEQSHSQSALNIFDNGPGLVAFVDASFHDAGRVVR